MDFSTQAEVFKGDTSEESCRRNADPQMLYLLMLAWVQSRTGINEWKAQVNLTAVDDTTDDLVFSYNMKLSVPKNKFDSEPVAMIIPEESE